MVISISGIDSAGKSTQIALLDRVIKKEDYRCCVKWSKARATPGVVFLKSIFRRDKHMDYKGKMAYREAVFQDTKKKKLLLFVSLLDLCIYWGLYFRILSLFHNFVILDRYLWDTYVEIKTDFCGIEFESWFVWKLLLKVTPKPDLSIILVVPLEVSLERDIKKTDFTVENPATIDSRERKINKIKTYYQLISQDKWNYVIDGTQPINVIHDYIVSLVMRNNASVKR